LIGRAAGWQKLSRWNRGGCITCLFPMDCNHQDASGATSREGRRHSGHLPAGQNGSKPCSPSSPLEKCINQKVARSTRGTRSSTRRRQPGQGQAKQWPHRPFVHTANLSPSTASCQPSPGDQSRDPNFTATLPSIRAAYKPCFASLISAMLREWSPISLRN
jgi:hypothetical protein